MSSPTPRFEKPLVEEELPKGNSRRAHERVPTKAGESENKHRRPRRLDDPTDEVTSPYWITQCINDSTRCFTDYTDHADHADGAIRKDMRGVKVLVELSMVFVPALVFHRSLNV